MDTAAAVDPPGFGRGQAVFTVDVEDWFQVSAFEAHLTRSHWTSYESRVERNTDRVLQLCAETGAKGTFFTLGWVADRHPSIIRRIVDAGHEIASHGYWHQRVPTLAEAEFREDVRRAKAVLEDVSGRSVRGYRAPSFSLTDDVSWARRVLVEEGYVYDSSIFPIARRGYGSAKGARHPYFVSTEAGALAEYPPAVSELWGLRIPVAGGGWFRQFPEWVTHAGIAAVLQEGHPAVFYVHPWELDPGQPRVRAPVLTRIRHYRGIRDCDVRLSALLGAFRFTSFEALFSAS